MPANKNISVCVATSPGPLIEIDANRTVRKPTGLRHRAARTSYVRRSPPPDPASRTSRRYDGGAGASGRQSLPASASTRRTYLNSVSYTCADLMIIINRPAGRPSAPAT